MVTRKRTSDEASTPSKKMTKEEREERRRKARDFEAQRVASRKARKSLGNSPAAPVAKKLKTDNSNSSSSSDEESKKLASIKRRRVQPRSSKGDEETKNVSNISSSSSNNNRKYGAKITDIVYMSGDDKDNNKNNNKHDGSTNSAKQQSDTTMADAEKARVTRRNAKLVEEQQVKEAKVTQALLDTILASSKANTSKDPPSSSSNNNKSAPQVLTPQRPPRTATRASDYGQRKPSGVSKPIFGSPTPEARSRLKSPPYAKDPPSSAASRNNARVASLSSKNDPPPIKKSGDPLFASSTSTEKNSGRRQEAKTDPEQKLSWHDSDEYTDSDADHDDDDDDDDDSSTGLNDEEREELRQVMAWREPFFLPPAQNQPAQRHRFVPPKSGGFCRALGLLVMLAGITMSLLSAFPSGMTWQNALHNFTQWWNPEGPPPPPCFIDSELAHLPLFELAHAQEAPHCDPKKVKHWLPCPDQGYCQGGRLQSCESEYYIMDDNRLLCIRTLQANETIKALETKLQDWTISHKCSTIKNPYVQLENINESKYPLFYYSQVSGEVEAGYDLKLIEEANQYDDTFQLKVQGPDVYIGLHDNYNLSLPLLCKVKKVVLTTLTYTCAATWIIAQSLLTWYWKHLYSAPTFTLLTSLIGLLVLMRARSMAKQRREKLDLANDIACVRQMVWEKLAQSGKPTASVHLRDQLVWELYETSKAGRNRLIHKVWPLIVADVNQDSRVNKVATVVNGKNTVIWQWVDANKPEPAHSTPTGSRVRFTRR